MFFICNHSKLVMFCVDKEKVISTKSTLGMCNIVHLVLNLYFCFVGYISVRKREENSSDSDNQPICIVYKEPKQPNKLFWHWNKFFLNWLLYVYSKLAKYTIVLEYRHRVWSMKIVQVFLGTSPISRWTNVIN